MRSVTPILTVLSFEASFDCAGMVVVEGLYVRDFVSSKFLKWVQWQFDFRRYYQPHFCFSKIRRNDERTRLFCEWLRRGCNGMSGRNDGTAYST